MKKFLLLIVFTTFLCCLTFADNDITSLPQNIDGIGAIQQYKTGKNTYVGINLNLEMLYIATETGSGFTHPQYAAKNDIAESIKTYYGKFSKNKYAQKFNKLSQKYAWNAYRTFPPQLVSEVLSYEQVLTPSKVGKGDPEFAALKIQQDLRRFYEIKPVPNGFSAKTSPNIMK